ncbi:hypothetical protein [Candidatus Entotheonella palauensis]|uniref:Uncharacterized protein n=1 Tax=Candidatus Entotheonella gemina TaxID=1429439 RepID=W4M2B7_9BACT|nr:hypothetical protein [Candidatus Entotheonella palauensis]ETX04330.1 MAG: hypothetical protein ETSY2_29400 [Candidatus Entotheonella gemina]
MWHRLIPATQGLCIGLWVFAYLMFGHAAQVVAASDANNPALAVLYGHYTLAATEKYRGGLTTLDEIHSTFGTGLSLFNDRFALGSETWHRPRYRLQSHPVVITEGEVQPGRWSYFFGYGMDRKSIDVLEIRQPEIDQQSRQYHLEVISHDEVWLLYDGWLLRFKRKTAVTK